MLRKGYVYILSTASGTALYTGVTADLRRRITEHKNKAHPGCFTARYNCNRLVYWMEFTSIADAIREEKRIKAGSRKSKITLIEGMNPVWKDLWYEFHPG